MLILTRRVGEKIFIGDDIVITVNKVRGRNQIVLGIDAPPDVPVNREEVRKRTKRA